jgi:hypothetical protein
VDQLDIKWHCMICFKTVRSDSRANIADKTD